jgi:glyoxylase-like metal-dependent hydrolase (beta-lactamase superfamily II)
MNRIRYGALMMLAALGAPCVHAQDALATIKAAEYALGMIRGPQRIDAINTMEVWGTGTNYNFGQAYRPDGPWPAFKITYHASYSYRTPAMRVDITRSNPDGPLQGGGLPLAAPQRQIQVVNGKYSWNESVPGAGFIAGSTATPAPAALNDRLLQMWTTPHGVLKAAERAANDAKVSRDGTFLGNGGDGVTIVTFPLPAPLTGITVKMTLNRKNQVEKVETKSDNPVLGDVVTETTYSDYKDLGEIATDVLFPSHILQKQGGFPVLDLTITKVDANNPYVVFPVPEVVEKAPSTAAPAKVETTKIADGVYYFTGGTHHSVAVEFGKYVALIECPFSEERTLAVIAAVKSAIPGKPIRYAIDTHHHFDHSSGLRACAAEGATIVAPSVDKPYYEKVWAQPHAIYPDALAKSGKKPVIEGVDEKRVITDGKQTIELYRLQGTDHAEGMLIAYLPKEKVLVEADVYTPAAAGAPSAPPTKEMLNLYDNIERLKLDVKQITPIHGRLVTMEDLKKAVGKN